MDDYIFSVNCDERNSGDVHHTISYHFFVRRAKNAGLLLSCEKTGHNKTGPGRMGDLLDHWSVRRLKEAGADGIKILL